MAFLYNSAFSAQKNGTTSYSSSPARRNSGAFFMFLAALKARQSASRPHKKSHKRNHTKLSKCKFFQQNHAILAKIFAHFKNL